MDVRLLGGQYLADGLVVADGVGRLALYQLVLLDLGDAGLHAQWRVVHLVDYEHRVALVRALEALAGARERYGVHLVGDGRCASGGKLLLGELEQFALVLAVLELDLAEDVGLTALSVGASPAFERVCVAHPVLPAVHVPEGQLALVAPGEVSVLVRVLRGLAVAVEGGHDVALVHLALHAHEVLGVGEPLAGVSANALAQMHAARGDLGAAHGYLELKLAAPRVRHVVDGLPCVGVVEVGAVLPEVRDGSDGPAARGERGGHGDVRRRVERPLVFEVVARELYLRGGRAVVGVDDAGACALLGHAVHDVLAPAPLEVLPNDAVALLKVREAHDG